MVYFRRVYSRAISRVNSRDIQSRDLYKYGCSSQLQSRRTTPLTKSFNSSTHPFNFLLVSCALLSIRDSLLSLSLSLVVAMSNSASNLSQLMVALEQLQLENEALRDSLR